MCQMPMISYRSHSEEIMGVPHAGIGPYVEMAFFHKRSRTLLITDAAIFVPQQAPQVVQLA